MPRLDEPIQPHPEGEEAISRLKSPYCPGLMLEVCSHPQSKILRDSLLAMAHAGEPADSIVAWMLASYGEEYRAVPRTRGGGLWAWAMPPMALIGGLLLVMILLRHFRTPNEAVTRPQVRLSEDDEAVLAAAMEELKASEEVPF
jgi:cytochrome c-type biogenesis protein CcmH/NrfF